MVKCLCNESCQDKETGKNYETNKVYEFTEERAKEVLQEIISKYKTTLYNSKTNETVVNVPKVFEMPIN